jgi:hypothetical protein
MFLELICPDGLVDFCGANGDIECTVEIRKVTGVPSESKERLDDVVSRGIKVCVVLYSM